VKDNVLKNTIGKIDEFFTIQNNSITYNIISESVANRMCKEIDYTVNTSIEQLFGNVNELTQMGILDSFDYSSTNYKFAVMLSYFDFIKEAKNDKTYRENAFYKGRRWSEVDGESVQKDNFYFFFNILKETFGIDNVPVIFLIKKFMGKAKYIEISTNNLASILSEDTKNENSEYHITFPEFDENSQNDLSDFTEYIKMIRTIKNDFLNQTTFNSKVLEKSQIDNFKTQITERSQKAIAEFENKVQNSENNNLISLVKKIKNDIVEFNSCNDIDVFKMLLLYQFYDIPYKMHFFLPELEITEKIDQSYDNYYCSLAFSTTSAYSFTKSCINAWVDFINIIEKISCLKQNIWNKVNVKLLSDWKKYFDKNMQQYELLASAAKNIFAAICASENIDAQVTNRLKSFDSLYNKLINRANGCDPDFPGNDFDEKFKQNFSNREERIEYYKSLVNNPNKENTAIVLKNIKDIVGLRIICKFENDVKKFHSLFYDIFDNIKSDIKGNFGLEVTSYKKYMVKRDDAFINDRGYYYTSNHYTFNLSETRKRLIEFAKISEITFELQVRTTLSQGVSDVSHDIYYKTNLPESLNKKLRELAEKANIKKHSWDLADIDEEFSKLKDQYENFRKEYKEYID
jgi:ppGpp synthetase/RelA/SpoT-type nucleotidyltranferase